MKVNIDGSYYSIHGESYNFGHGPNELIAGIIDPSFKPPAEVRFSFYFGDGSTKFNYEKMLLNESISFNYGKSPYPNVGIAISLPDKSGGSTTYFPAGKADNSISISDAYYVKDVKLDSSSSSPSFKVFFVAGSFSGSFFSNDTITTHEVTGNFRLLFTAGSN